MPKRLKGSRQLHKDDEDKNKKEKTSKEKDGCLTKL